jgi:hypothetical protein
MYYQVKVLVPATAFHPEHYCFTNAYLESQDESTMTLVSLRGTERFTFKDGYCNRWWNNYEAWITQPITWEEANQEDYIILTESLAKR